jgi:aminopeptidase YwaD
MNPEGYAPAGLIAAVVAVSSLALGSLITLPVETSPASSLLAAGSISTDQYMKHVRFLADPDMMGRGNGSDELERAADYLAAQFRIWGLRPAGDDGSYFQTFELITDTEIGDGNRLTLGGEELVPGEDFSAVRFTAPVSVTESLVFVGYGITAPEMHWDDYAGVDVMGKIVVAFRHEPQEREEDSPFNGAEFTSHASLMNKAINAKQHGAAGIIFILDPNNHEPEEEEILRTATRSETDNSGIAAVYARSEPLLTYFQSAGFDLAELQRDIDTLLESRSFELNEASASLTTDVTRIRKPVRNVVAAIDGSDPALKNEWVIAGAHYDHLGLDGEFSLAGEDADGQIHHGADDNASGTSGILELARIASSNRSSFKRSVLLMAFAGEEVGLRGSSHFVANPTVDIENVVAMLNLDMIGRLRNSHIYVSGVGTSPLFRDVLEELNEPIGLALDYSDSGMGASDHMSFNIKRIPVLFFFSGLHGDYHKPSDTAEKINPDGARNVLMLAYQVLNELANNSERPLYTEVDEPRPVSTGGGGYGPYFGSVPDFRDDLGGVLFADVSTASPAAEAGLRAGDLLVEFAGKPIENLYDFTYALQAEQPGNTIAVIVERNGERVAAEVTLGSR